MCLAIFRPSGAPGRITRDQLQTSRDDAWNDDAFGVMYADGGKLHTWKSTHAADWDPFVEWVAELQEADVPLAVHLRYATHGEKDERNAHPVDVIPGQSAIVHNGIISECTGSETCPDSDTVRFAEILRQLPKNWHRNPSIVRLAESFLGGGNKVAWLHRSGDWRILNAELGVWDDGIWYSNKSYDRDWNNWTDMRWHTAQSSAFPAYYPAEKPGGIVTPVTGIIRPTANDHDLLYPVACALSDMTIVCSRCVDEFRDDVDANRHSLAFLFADDCKPDDRCDICGEPLVQARPIDLESFGDVAAREKVKLLTAGGAT